MKLLLRAGADPDILEDDESTPIMAAAAGGDIEMVQVLKNGGALLDHKDQRGKTALDHARKGGSEAVRVNVRLGQSSVNTIEIVDGLRVGDVVILSDMSAWDAHDRVRLR